MKFLVTHTGFDRPRSSTTVLHQSVYPRINCEFYQYLFDRLQSGYAYKKHVFWTTTVEMRLSFRTKTSFRTSPPRSRAIPDTVDDFCIFWFWRARFSGCVFLSVRRERREERIKNIRGPRIYLYIYIYNTPVDVYGIEFVSLSLILSHSFSLVLLLLLPLGEQRAPPSCRVV